MRYIPHDYQRYAIDFIKAHPVSAVLLDMGLGKTSICLTALQELLFDEFKIRKILVVAPLRVARDTWPCEIRKWDHLQGLSFSVVVGSESERMEALRNKADIYIVNRENLQWLIEKSGIRFDFDTVVLDELSSFKNHQAKRFRSLMKARHLVKRMIGLTGTPSSNGLMDLWAEYRILDDGCRLGRYIGRYRAAYFTPDKRNGAIVYSYKPVPGAEESIYDRISDITISMKTTDYLKLPECVMNEIPVCMDDEEKKVYDNLRDEMTACVKGQVIDAVNAAVLSGKLLQMANGAVYDEERRTIHRHDRKLDCLEELIEAMNGKPVLVAYWFKHDAERIRSRFQVREINTAKDIEDWNMGRIPVAMIHPASAGHGLNLQQGGSTLIWFGLTWSLELYQQTNARLHRQGQKETVFLHHIICKGTMDEDVIKALRRKERIQDALIEAVRVNLRGGI